MADKNDRRAGTERRGPALLILLNQLTYKLFYFVFSKIFSLLLWVTNVFIILILMFARIVNRILYTFMFYMPKVIGSWIPKRRLHGLEQQMTFAGMFMNPNEVVGLTMVYSIALALTTFIITSMLGKSVIYILCAAFGAFAFVWFVPYVLINLLIERRTDSIENVLPDVLSMVSQNMLAGMTSYNALWTAARPEFGPLAVEIQSVAKSTLTGIPLTDALVSMTNNVKSDKLARTIRLIVQGMKAGGDLPSVLQGISRDMRMEYNLRKQMAAETSAHAIFIMFAILIGAPLLFSVSHQFISIFSTLMNRVDISVLKEQAPMSMITLSHLSITPEFFQIYAIAILIVSGFFGALLVGLLRTGKPISGVSNIPVFTVVAVGVFLILRYALGLFFGSMFVV